MRRGMRAQILLSLALFLALFLAGYGIADAQAYGRVTVVVTSEQGAALEGVEVVVTCDKLPRFREELVTNKKGKAVVSFTDATKVYNFSFTYADHQPAKMTIKPRIRQTLTREVILSEGQVVTTQEGGTERRVRYSPAERVFNEGVEALKAGDMATAKGKFLEAVGKNDQMAAAHSALAGVYLEEKDYPSAVASANRLLAIEPANTRGFRMLYDAHKGLGNQDQADKALKKLTESAKGDSDAIAMVYNEGVQAVKVGDFTSAKARFLEAVELDPNLKEAIGALAVIFIKEENYQKAVEYAERHLALVTEGAAYKRSLRIRWDSYRELGDADKTQMAYETLVAADPQVLAVELYNKGIELFHNGDSAAAIAEFEQVLAIDPENAKAHYHLGVSHVGTGNNDAAKQHLQKFIEMAPEDPDASTAKDMLAYLN